MLHTARYVKTRFLLLPLCLLLLSVLFLTKSSRAMAIQETNLKNYTLENAKAEPCVLIENSAMTKGNDLWDSFLRKTASGKPQTIRLVKYYDRQTVSPDAPAQNLYVSQLAFDGESFTYLVNFDGTLARTSWKYLKHYEAEPPKFFGQDAESTKEEVWFLTNASELTYPKIRGTNLSGDSDAIDALSYKVVFALYTRANEAEPPPFPEAS